MVNKTLESYYEGPEPLDKASQIETALADSIQKANEIVVQTGQEDEHLADMGATVVSAVVTEEQVVIANVGDSRAYRLRAGVLEQLTIDQTMAQELYDNGILNTQEFQRSPLNHTLLQVVGQNEAVDVQLTRRSFLPGDVLLLCSDGLSNVVNEADIVAILSQFKGEAAAEKLIERANANGGPDNITVVVLHVPES